MNYLDYERSKSIELLQYYFFVKETYFFFVVNGVNSENIMIEEFLNSLNWQLRKVEDY